MGSRLVAAIVRLWGMLHVWSPLTHPAATAAFSATNCYTVFGGGRLSPEEPAFAAWPLWNPGLAEGARSAQCYPRASLDRR